MALTVRGVHLVEAPEPCYLIEAELTDGVSFDWGKVTQEIPTQPRGNWQVAYDEQPLDPQRKCWVFFFHYLDVMKPLLTSDGPVKLPAPTPRPARLNHIHYVEP